MLYFFILSNNQIIKTIQEMNPTFGKDTPILMYDGTIKKVQDIVVGDQLMGENSTSKTVLTLLRGKTLLYNIIPEKGLTYTVSKNHVLSLKKKSTYSIIDIPLLEYIDIVKLEKEKENENPSQNYNPLLGYRVAIDYPYKEMDLDPYFLGYYLGNDKIHQTSQEKINLEKLSIYKLKHIPQIYKSSNLSSRLSLLAGIIDSIGTLVTNKYEIIHNNKVLIEDIIYICHSVGLAVYKTLYKTLYKIYIYGQGIEDIPVKSVSNKMFPLAHSDVLRTSIIIRKKYIDKYYGFTTNGNHRILLDDFTVA